MQYIIKVFKRSAVKANFLKGLLFTTTSEIKSLNCFDRCQVKKIHLVNSLIGWGFYEIKKNPLLITKIVLPFVYYIIILFSEVHYSLILFQNRILIKCMIKTSRLELSRYKVNTIRFCSVRHACSYSISTYIIYCLYYFFRHRI